MAGPFDCALGTIDPGRFNERRERGESVLFAEPGTWGCAIVAVVMRADPLPDGGGAMLTPVDGGAYPVLFDPAGLPAVRRDPKPVVVGGCTDVRFSDGSAFVEGHKDDSPINLVLALAGVLSEAPLSAPPCDPRVDVSAAPDGTYVVPVPTIDSYPELLAPGSATSPPTSTGPG
jgi:hypothetical protein